MQLALAAEAPALAAWSNFFVIIGTAAATLTGLMFIVVTLLPNIGPRINSEGVATFSTPSVVHFCVALFLSAALSAPWPTLWPVGSLLGLSGLGGVAYVALVMARAHRQSSYQPVLEDWLWHGVIPFIAYGTLMIMAFLFLSHPADTLYGVAASQVLLLFTGIHNAWDNVTYLALTYGQRNVPPDKPPEL